MNGPAASGVSGLAVAELLIDTDVFVDHIRGARVLPPLLKASYSIITRCELFAGDEHEEVAVQAVLAPLTEIGLERSIAEHAGRLRRATRLATPDAVIAATALERDLVLITRNRRDFERVSGLRLRDPASL